MKYGIFLSYRRDDVRHVAGRLARDLEDAFGKGRVFRDVEDISPGLDFTEVLTEALDSCAVMLVLIGSKWLDLKDASGNRRIENPKDWGRIEIATGLERNVRVVPVLVEGAQLPEESKLPDKLKALVRRQAIPLSDERWRGDVNRLVQALRRIPELENIGDPLGSSETRTPSDVNHEQVIPDELPAEVEAGRPRHDVSRPVQAKEKRVHGWPQNLLVAAVASVLVIGVAVWLVRDWYTKVTVVLPDVAGSTSTDAHGEIERLCVPTPCFGVKTTQAASNTVLAGHVIETRPSSGAEVREGADVTLVVSTGPAPAKHIIVPNLVRVPKSDAKARLESLCTPAPCLDVQVVYVDDALVEEGLVIKSRPEHGTKVVRMSEVDLVVSSGPKDWRVPDLYGQSMDNADTALDDLGLLADTTVIASTHPQGTVLRQSPLPGNYPTRPSVVNLHVASGPSDAYKVEGAFTKSGEEYIVNKEGTLQIRGYVHFASQLSLKIRVPKWNPIAKCGSSQDKVAVIWLRVNGKSAGVAENHKLISSKEKSLGPFDLQPGDFDFSVKSGESDGCGWPEDTDPFRITSITLTQ